MRTLEEVNREIKILEEERECIRLAKREIDFKNKTGDFNGDETCVGDNRCYWIYTCNRPEKKLNKACPTWSPNPH